ncbi:MAG: hypothetical protein R2940_05765 [Syntrophotaleaceae bacterium]
MNRAAFVFLVAAFVWAPLSPFFESPWAGLLFVLLPLFSLLLLILECWEETSGVQIPPGFNALLILIAFGLVQLIPLPPAVVRVLSPNSWTIYRDSLGHFQNDVWVPLTLTPKATLSALLGLIGCWAAYVAGANLLVEEKRLKIAASLFTVIAGVIALFFLGLWVIGALSGQNLLKSMPGPEQTALASSIMVIFCIFGLVHFLAERPTVNYGNLQERINDFFFSFRTKGHVVYLVPALIIPLALLLVWPGALQILLLNVILVLVLLGLRSRGRRVLTYLFGYLLLVLILALISFIGRESRGFDTARQAETVDESAVSSELVADFLLTGAGYGSFPSVSQRYRVIRSTDKLQNTAGQSFIPMISQGGLFGLAAAAWFLTNFLILTFHRWWSRRNKQRVYLFPAGLAGILSFILCYLSWGGTGPQEIFLPVSILFGITAASAKPLPQTRQENDPLQVNRPITVFLTISALFFAAFFSLGELAGQNFYDQARNLVAEKGEAREYSRKMLVRATFFDPFNSHYHFAQGYLALDSGKEAAARRHFIEGIRLAPLDSSALFSLGQLMFESGNADSGKKLLQAALKNAPLSREIQSAYIGQLIRTGQIKEAFALIRHFLQVRPEDTLFWVQVVSNLGIEDVLRPQILPESSRSYHDYGMYLLEKGEPEKADRFFRRALGYARKEKKTEKAIFLSMVGFFEKNRNFDHALDALLLAREKFPDDASLLMASGRVYEQMGITFKAREIYQEVLIIDPGNEDARRRMDILDTVF